MSIVSRELIQQRDEKILKTILQATQKLNSDEISLSLTSFSAINPRILLHVLFPITSAILALLGSFKSIAICLSLIALSGKTCL